MKRRFLAAGLFLLTSATLLLAGRPGSVVTTEGQTLNGDITEKGDTVTIVRNGITSVFPRDQVASIDYSTYAERFERSLAALGADDVEGRLALARDAFDQREYDLAQRAVDSAIDLQPVNRDALELSRSIANQIALEAARQKPAATAPATQAVTAPERRTTRGLSPDQINIVRQRELRPGDNVRIQFRNNARKAFVDSQPGLSFRDFSTLTDTDQALQILEKGSEQIKRDVIILTDPAAIRSFSRNLNTAVIQGCATSVCHGGANGGDFRLLSGTPDSSTLVTNFYLLSTYRKAVPADAQRPFDPSERWMIDRGDARISLLYQYALPRAQAVEKHPQVRNWDGIVVNTTDRFLADLTEWMERELVPVTPNYGFEFKLADRAANLSTTEPATEATSEPTTQPKSDEDQDAAPAEGTP